MTLADSLKGLAEAEVALSLDTSDKGLIFGIIGESATQRWWKKFTDRFGTIAWRTTAGESKPGAKDGELVKIMADARVEAVLVETGRLRKSNPVWKAPQVAVVMSLDGWRECPPEDWTTSRKKVSHAQLGGVTDGEFLIHIAYRGPFEDFDWCENLPGVPAKLVHVLSCIGSGRKIPIPEGVPDGWAAGERLCWANRFKKIATPTVYYKDSWVKRRLELKELKGMLDIPVLDKCGVELRERMKAMRMPGKVYGALLSKISRGFRNARKRKRKASASEGERREEEGTETRKEDDSKGFGTREETSEKELAARPEAAGGKKTNTAKATKADNASIPVFLWNEAICRGVERLDGEDPKVSGAFDVI
jgi:hypothetical protein